MKQSCSKRFQPSNTVTLCHLKKCRAQCSECYYSDICLPGKSKHARSCCLGSKYGSQKGNHPGCGVEWLVLCQICIRMSITEQYLRREARDGFLIKRLAGEIDACSECGALLQNNGPFWWVCAECSCECKDHIHPPWIERIDV